MDKGLQEAAGSPENKVMCHYICLKNAECAQGHREVTHWFANTRFEALGIVSLSAQS